MQGFNFGIACINCIQTLLLVRRCNPNSQITLLEYGVTDKTANISAKSDPYAEGKYLLPYRKNAANIGFQWTKLEYKANTCILLVTKQFHLTTLFRVLTNMKKVLPFIRTRMEQKWWNFTWRWISFQNNNKHLWEGKGKFRKVFLPSP